MNGIGMVALLLLLAACKANPVAPTPLAHLQMAAEAAVALENTVEDPETDRHEASLIESIADMLNAPWMLLKSGLTVQVTVFWVLGDAIAGNIEGDGNGHFNKRFEQVWAWIPGEMASYQGFSSWKEMEEERQSREQRAKFQLELKEACRGRIINPRYEPYCLDGHPK